MRVGRSAKVIPTATRRILAVPLLVMLAASVAQAGRNAGGALIVHTNDAVSYTYSGDYCGIDYDAPDSCGAAGTRIDKDENTPAVIWLLAAFPDSSSPAVTAIQFGIEHNLPSEQGYFENYEMCGSVELPDAGWPETGFGNLVSFGSAVKTDRLFPFYVFAVYGFEDAYFGTAVYPSTGMQRPRPTRPLAGRLGAQAQARSVALSATAAECDMGQFSLVIHFAFPATRSPFLLPFSIPLLEPP